MNVRHTNSLCPVCYREIPAMITTEPEGVVMFKSCPQHGPHRSLMERDPSFYEAVMASKPGIYPGYFVDVTRVCNTRCSVCYYPLEQEDPEGLFTIENILSDCAANIRHAPFVLTGGEPTVRKDIVTLIERVGELGPVEMLTNGIRMADPDTFEAIAKPLTRGNGVLAVHLSIHPQTQAWIKVLAQVAERNLTLGSVLLVVNSKEEFLEALKIVERIGPLALCCRIKAASRIWNEQKPGSTDLDGSKVFVSDMLRWLQALGEVEVILEPGSKSVFVNVLWKGLWLMLVSWHDVGNVDLLDIECPPYYRARNGRVENFVTAGLINEGLTIGWQNGEWIKEEPVYTDAS